MGWQVVDATSGEVLADGLTEDEARLEAIALAERGRNVEVVQTPDEDG